MNHPMKRFRFTFLAVCMLLTWLGSSDLLLQLRNPQPLAIELSQLPEGPPPQEWMRITGGQLDLLQAINMSGTIEIDAFLVPLVGDAASDSPRVWVETRDPAVANLLTTYYFKLDSDQQREDYLAAHRAAFHLARAVTGMTADNLVASANQSKLLDLLSKFGIQPREDILFLSEGKSPNRWRGPLFLGIALLGIFKFIWWHKKPTSAKPNQMGK